MRKIGVLTSGGDAPGMNAAIRAVTRTALERGWEVAGIRQGFAGLVAATFVPFQRRDVGEIMQRGGTILGSSRSKEFPTEEGRAKALRNLAGAGIDALAVIGGNGSQTGSRWLAKAGFPVVGVASTIDNDLCGTDITIGVDTALNVALEAIDRLKTTASSHQRAHLVETMGRDCGYLALMAGITGGAEVIIIPEVETDPEAVARELHAAYDRGKSHAIVVAAEGAKYNAAGLTQYFADREARIGFQLRTTVLGHMQRGGIPTFADRLLATRLGAAAVEALAAGQTNVLIGMKGGVETSFPLDEIAGRVKPLDTKLFEVARILSR
ncbi:MAG: 6-phosphofructokinase [Bryobacterales bacterium]|nr:6-phosphofructokinase [Bryobacterales bacterium]